MEKKNIFVFHIDLEDSSPRIWRELRVPGDFTLGDFHAAIQIAFGWTDSHLHSFTIKKIEYMMDPEPGMDFMDMDREDVRYEDDYCLDDFNFRARQSFSYLYDFGDSWEHKITVSKVLPFKEDEAAPLCLGGEYAGPIEDSGGVWGYAEILEILKDPKHEQYEDTVEWAGKVDPLAFDLEKINRALKKAFKPVRAAGKGSGGKAGSGGGGNVQKMKPVSGSASPKDLSSNFGTPKTPGGNTGKSVKEELSDEKLKKLYALMGRVKELKPWKKLWDTDLILIKFPDREPAVCSVMGMEEYSFGIAVYPGFAPILSLFRMLNSESDNPFVFLGYQDCFLCHLGQRNELFPEEIARLKKMKISFRGKNDWIYFRKAVPGYSPWHINGKDADLLIEILTRFIDAYTAFEGGLNVDFEDDQVICHRYSEDDGKWITEAGRMPPIPMERKEYTVDSGEVEPLRFKKRLKTKIEVETLFFPHAIAKNKDGVPVLARMIILMNTKTGTVLDQCFLEGDDDENNMTIDVLFTYIKKHGRPDTIKVRDEIAAAVLSDFCGKIGVNLIHSEGMPAVDTFVQNLPSFLDPLDFPGDE